MEKKIFKYFKNGYKNIKDLWKKSINKPTFELVEFKEDPNSLKTILFYKVVNKATFPLSALAEHLVEDNELISMFSQLDVRTITFFATKDKLMSQNCKNKNIYEIIMQAYSEDGEAKIIFKDLQTNQTKIKLAKKIFSNETLFSKFDKKDLLQIGYLVGYHEHEQNMISMSKTDSANEKQRVSM